MTALVKIYVEKIEKGKLQIEQVPTRWREEVAEELLKLQNENETES